MTVNAGGIYGLNQIASPQVHSLGIGYQNDSTPVNPIGGIIRRHNALYRYVKLDASDVAPSAGAPAYATVFTPSGTLTAVPVFTVSADQSDSCMGLQPVGVFTTLDVTPTNGYYIWIQIGGRHPACLVAGAVAGDVLIGSATDNVFAKISDGSALTNVVVGRVCGTSASGASPTLLMNMDW